MWYYMKHIEVDFCGCDTTRGSVHLFFCKDEAVVELSFDFCVADGCWLDDTGNEGFYKRTTTNYEGGTNTLVL